MPDPRPTPDDLRALDPEGNFIKRLQNDHEAVASLSDSGDLEPLKVIVHQLAGAAATFGYPELGDIAIALDDSFRQREPAAADIARLLAALEQALGLPAKSA